MAAKLYYTQVFLNFLNRYVDESLRIGRDDKENIFVLERADPSEVWQTAASCSLWAQPHRRFIILWQGVRRAEKIALHIDPTASTTIGYWQFDADNLLEVKKKTFLLKYTHRHRPFFFWVFIKSIEEQHMRSLKKDYANYILSLI